MLYRSGARDSKVSTLTTVPLHCISTVSIGAYAAALHALNNMDRDLLLVAKDDELARKLQDLGLPVRKRAPKRRW